MIPLCHPKSLSEDHEIKGTRKKEEMGGEREAHKLIIEVEGMGTKKKKNDVSLFLSSPSPPFDFQAMGTRSYYRIFTAKRTVGCYNHMDGYFEGKGVFLMMGLLLLLIRLDPEELAGKFNDAMVVQRLELPTEQEEDEIKRRSGKEANEGLITKHGHFLGDDILLSEQILKWGGVIFTDTRSSDDLVEYEYKIDLEDFYFSGCHVYKKEKMRSKIRVLDLMQRIHELDPRGSSSKASIFWIRASVTLILIGFVAEELLQIKLLGNSESAKKAERFYRITSALHYDMQAFVCTTLAKMEQSRYFERDQKDGYHIEQKLVENMRLMLIVINSF